MKCHHDPKKTTGPIGMYHCPECGDMVIAGLDHPDMDEVDARYEEYCNERYQRLKDYFSSHLGDGFDIINKIMDDHVQVRNAMLEIWLRADMNADFNCCRCNKKTVEYRLYCSPFCQKADEIQQLEKKDE